MTRDDSALHFYGSESVIEWWSEIGDSRKIISSCVGEKKRHIEVVFRVTKNVLKRQEFLTAFHTCVLADLPMTMILCSDFLLAVKINFPKKTISGVRDHCPDGAPTTVGDMSEH